MHNEMVQPCQIPDIFPKLGCPHVLGALAEVADEHVACLHAVNDLALAVRDDGSENLSESGVDIEVLGQHDLPLCEHNRLLSAFNQRAGDGGDSSFQVLAQRDPDDVLWPHAQDLGIGKQIWPLVDPLAQFEAVIEPRDGKPGVRRSFGALDVPMGQDNLAFEMLSGGLDAL